MCHSLEMWLSGFHSMACISIMKGTFWGIQVLILYIICTNVSHFFRKTSRDSLSLPLHGIPALFLPGNAGSHKQARSSASIALRMHLSDFKTRKHFDFFTIDFNEASF